VVGWLSSFVAWQLGGSLCACRAEKLSPNEPKKDSLKTKKSIKRNPFYLSSFQ